MFYTRENIIKEEVNKQSKKDEDYLDFLHESIKEKLEEFPQKYNINYFMDWIYNKPKKDNKFSLSSYIKRYKYDREFKKFINSLRKDVSPGFGMLWHIVIFIKLLKVTYFYRYNSETNLFLIDDIQYDRPNNNISGFKLYMNKYIIEIELERLSKKIKIKVIDTLQSKSKSEISKEEFIDGELKLNTIVDEFRFEFLIGLIMNRVANLLEFYYKMEE